MPLPSLFSVPNDQFGWDSFVYWNWVDHQEIQQAILAQRTVNLPIYPFPAISRPDRWLDLNQAAHNDMNQVLGVAGRDLEGVDLDNPEQLRDWLWWHAQEHQAARQVLKI